MRSATAGIARWTAIAAIAVNIALHAYLTPMHLDEMFYVGVLFCVGDAAFAAAALMLASAGGRVEGWALAVALSVGEFGGFVASRTVGLPLGYKEEWSGAPEDVLGWVSLPTEVVIVAAAIVAARHAAASRPGTGARSAGVIGVRSVLAPRYRRMHAPSSTRTP